MNNIKSFLSKLSMSLIQTNQRYGLTLSGSEVWKGDTIDLLIQLIKSSHSSRVIQLGGPELKSIDHHVHYKKGAQLLGQECSLLVCDFESGFDANSFNSALGALVGGGILIILSSPTSSGDLAIKWLQSHLNMLLRIEENEALPKLPVFESHRSANLYLQQNEAVNNVIKVVEGHRKRPLLLTADRGRGKSSALGIAAAELMQKRNIRIAVTAPSVKSVAPVFQHAARLLNVQSQKNYELEYERSQLIFASPDDVVKGYVSCDVLFVDEASAIPISMLKKMVNQYSRLVLSTTIHGYEGCGRGFTLKFVEWLKQSRPNYRAKHLTQPIRWGENDWLESWQYKAFLLDSDEVDTKPVCLDTMQISQVDKSKLLQEPDSLRSYFALLVSAHYQTSPNDLFTLLSDPAIKLFVAECQGKPIACMLGVEEGGLSEKDVEQIKTGLRRPKGHLVATSILNSFGIQCAATQKSLRLMRVAVDPKCQRQGVASKMLDYAKRLGGYDFLSTSYGATFDLLRFWQKNEFHLIKVGSKRDTASGCHSALMVFSTRSNWLKKANFAFTNSLTYNLMGYLRNLETDIAKELVFLSGSQTVSKLEKEVVHLYVQGGASFETAAAQISSMLFSLPYDQLIQVSGLLISKVVQQRSFQFCAETYGFTGRKQIELALKSELRIIESQFTL